MEKNENKSFQSSQHLLARELTHRLKGKWKEDEFQASGKFSLDPSEPKQKRRCSCNCLWTKQQSFGGESGNRTPTLALCQPEFTETTTKPNSTAQYCIFLQHNTGILLFSWKHKVHQDRFLLLLLIPVRVPRPENNIILPAATWVSLYLL